MNTEAGTPDPEPEIENPARWFFARDEEAEYWHFGGETREEAIAGGRARYPGECFHIQRCRRMTPSFSIFDADDLIERIGEDECWGEDGFDSAPDGAPLRELERELAATFRRWWVRHKIDLTGTSLDYLDGNERIDPAAPDICPCD